MSEEKIYCKITEESIKVSLEEATPIKVVLKKGGSGDMKKSQYDVDNDGIVDKAESVDDGAGNSSTAAEVKDAVDKKHVRSHALNSSSDHTSSITENNLIDADANGLPADSGISVSDVSDVISKEHTHLNKIILDAIEESLTTALKALYDDAVSKAHTHSNKAILDLIEQALTTALKSAYDDAVTKTHSHSNKAILDLIEKAFTTVLKNKLDGIESLAVSLATVKSDSDIADSISKKHASTLLGTKNIDETNIGDGKTIAYDSVGDKLEYVTNVETDEKVKSSATDTTSGYLDDKVDDVNIAIESEKISVKTGSNLEDSIDKRHTQGTDTELGSMAADIDMNNYSILNLKDDSITFNGGGSLTRVDYLDAISKKHTQGTDQSLDLGGANEVSASQTKSAYTHSQVISGNPHSVTKDEVGLGNVPNIDTTDSVSKAHDQNTDTILKDSSNNDVINDATIKKNISIDNLITIDGRDLSVDGTKLDGIESGATEDQTGAEIKSLYEAEANTNAYTDAEKSKLAGIESSADVTDSVNVDAAGAVMESDYNANTILAATADNTPNPLTINEQTLVGRITSGNISALTATQARTLINVEDGADVTATHQSASTASIAGHNVNELDDITSPGADIEDAVSKKHATTVLGTKSVDETDIGDGKALVYNSVSGNLEYEDVAGSPGGNDTEIQWNDSGAFGADSDFTFDDTIGNKVLTVGGKIVAQGLFDTDKDTGVEPNQGGVDEDKLRFRTAGTERWQIDNSGHLLPGANNSYDIGSDALPIREVFTEILKLADNNEIKGIDNFTIKLDANNYLKVADRIELNISLLSFRQAEIGSLIVDDMVQSMRDEYEDESGIDTGTSTNEDYDSVNDLYSPVVTSDTELDYMEYATDGAAQTAYVSSDAISLDSNTKLMLNLNNNVTDISDSGHTINNTNVTFDSGTKKFGSHSAVFNGSTAYLDSVDSANWDIIASDADNWTLNFWVKHNDHVDYERYICQFEDTNNWWALYHVHGNGLRFYVRSVGAELFSTGSGGEITDTNWHHIALCKVANKYGIYLDGIQVCYVQDSSTDTFAGSLYIGMKDSSDYFYGYMDDIRISNDNLFNANPDAGLTDTITIPASEQGAVNLQCYSESSIKQQGSYSLKGVALIADSLNDTLTRDLSGGSEIDLTDIDELTFYVYSSRTGTNLRLKIHDSGGTTSTKDIVISSANTWEQKTWDISGVTNANKDDIDSIIIEVINADAENTFYIDDFIAPGITHNMTLVSQTFTAESQPDNAKIIIFEEDVDAITENTDYTGEVSRDGGTTYTQATLVDIGDYESGKRILSGLIDISGQPAGTSMIYRIKTLNNKNCKTHGTCLIWD